jgi:hypothetical protein
MISTNTLKYLAGQRIKDAKVLFTQNRNSAAIYLMGYALEFSFKRKISNTLGFANGFPETPREFNLYGVQTAAFNHISTGITLNQVTQIRNHDLNKLIIFSGAELRIISSFLTEWNVVKSWNPENRYKRRKFTSSQVRLFIRSAKVIIGELN